MKKKATAAAKIKTRYVGFPLYDDVTLVDFVGATEVFSFTNSLFTPVWFAAEKKPIKTSEGGLVFPHYTFKEKHPHIDILFVPGGGGGGVSNAMFNKDIQDFIKKTAATAEWVGSVCTGAFVLAASGVLQNCEATTYWSQIPNLKLLKDKYKLKFPKGYPRGVIDSKAKRFTGGGISSSIDLTLELVEKLCGKKQAQSAQLSIQYAPKPPVNAGDPEQAPKWLVKQMLKDSKDYSKIYYDAVQKLLKH
jgi:cyclohexyl-isocyanide hydratase